LRFLISGYYGFANLGDEALLAEIVAGLKTRYPLAEIDVLSATPEITAHDYGVEATQRMDLRAIAKSIERCDVVLSGGGGLLQNTTSLKSLLYYAGIVRSGIQAGKKTMIFAQSIGPLDFFGRQTVRRFCSGVTAATVRDESSRELLASLLPGVTVERTADPVFLYDLPERPPDLAAAGLYAASDPLAIVAVRKTARFEEASAAVAVAVDALAERHGVHCAFVPFGGQADAEAATVVIRKCRSKPTLVALDGLDAIASAIARARVVVGVRLHALILAARFGVPFLALAYDPKVDALCRDLGYPLPPLWSPALRALDPAGIAQAVDEVWTRGPELRAQLEASTVRLRAAAEGNFDVLARIAGG
jgi:polysaccharide pyruvyl transferase CsaB